MNIFKLLRKNYNLTDAFQTLGNHLYGEQWTGNEIWGRRVADPMPNLEARAPLEARMEELCLLINQKQKERGDADVKDAILEINRDLAQLDDECGQLAKRLFEIEKPDGGAKNEHAEWERFVKTEGHLLKGLGNGAITVIGSHGTAVRKELWRELPDEFGYDWMRSLIFFPKTESGYMMQSGYIALAEFDEWLTTVPSYAPSDEETKEIIEAKAGVWLTEKIKKEGDETRDWYIAEMRKKFDLTGHGARRVWDKNAPPHKKRSGRPANNKSKH